MYLRLVNVFGLFLSLGIASLDQCDQYLRHGAELVAWWSKYLDHLSSNLADAYLFSYTPYSCISFCFSKIHRFVEHC